MTTDDHLPAYDDPGHAPEPVDLPESAAEPDEAPAPTALPEVAGEATPQEPVEEPVETTAFAEPPAWEPEPAALPDALPDAPAVAEPEPDPVLPPAADLPLAAAPEPDLSPAYDGQETAAEAPAGRRGPLVPVLAALVVVLAGLTGFLGWEAKRTAGPAPVVATREDAVASAREAARLVFSYDYRQLDKDFAAGRAVTVDISSAALCGKKDATAEEVRERQCFRSEYERTTAKLKDDFAPRYKAVVTADVSASSVVRADDDEVVCLVFVNQVSTSSLVTAPKVTQSRLEMTMKRVDGRWRVAKIDAL